MRTIRFKRDKSQFMSTVRKNVNGYFQTKGISTKGNWKMILDLLRKSFQFKIKYSAYQLHP